MSKLIYSAAMSLNGFIAGPGGDMAWMRPAVRRPEPRDRRPAARHPGAADRQPDIPRRRRPNEETERGGACGGTWNGPSFVLTHDVDQAPAGGVTFVGDLATAIADTCAVAGDGDVCILGADIARQCLEAGELDEILVMVLPVLLGDGTPLFNVPGGRTCHWRR
jgi:dihydrofolate reductase